MSKPIVLVVGPLPQNIMDALSAAYEIVRYWTLQDKEKELAAVADRVRGIATTGHYGASRALMDSLPQVEIIASFGVGYDAVDIAAAREKGIRVTNTPDVLTDDVGNLAVLLLLAVSREMLAADRYVRSGDWRAKGDMALTRSIRGKKAGVIGLGRIGKNIADKLAVFGMQIQWHGPRDKPDAGYPYQADLVAMASDVDYLIVACPGGAATRHIVGASVLDALGPEGTLINISRGSCVDEAALLDAVTTGRLGWAGLDVFEEEPNVPQALVESPRTVLLPHVGSATVETRTAMGNLVVENLALHFAGEPLATPVV